MLLLLPLLPQGSTASFVYGRVVQGYRWSMEGLSWVAQQWRQDPVSQWTSVVVVVIMLIMMRVVWGCVHATDGNDACE